MTTRRRFRPLVDRLDERCLLTGPGVIGPLDVKAIYGFAATFNINGRVAPADGSGQTIAIVDAYYDPTIQNDLNVFDAAYHLPGIRLNVQVQSGTPSTASDPGGTWGPETALDVEYAHAIAPGANILLVEARSTAPADLLNAVNFARQYAGVSVVSMSFGFADGARLLSNERTLDSQLFVTPAGHTPVTFVAATGDNGSAYDPGAGQGGASYPATSPNVLAVGGTSFVYDPYGNVRGETGWSGSGGGNSNQEPEPSFQRSVQGSGQREIPDVSFLAASPSVWVYSTAPGRPGGWITETGTSAGAPQWAGLIAVVDEGRGMLNKAPLDGATQTLPAIYSFASDFHDVVGGSNGYYTAATGYDRVTGLGTPVPGRLIPDLIFNVASAPNAGRSVVSPVVTVAGAGVGASFGVASPLQSSAPTALAVAAVKDAELVWALPPTLDTDGLAIRPGTRPRTRLATHDLALAALMN